MIYLFCLTKTRMESSYLGFVWGISMISQDLATYYLYLLLPTTFPKIINCDNFLEYYTMFVFINTITSGIFYPVSGWITDVFHKKSNWIFFLSSVVQLSCVLILIIPYFFPGIFGNKGWIIICILWQLGQLCYIQGSNSLWKLIKNNIKIKHENNLTKINHIGNVGDLTSDIIETFILTLLLILSICFQYDSMYFFVIYIFVSSLIINIFLCLNSVYLIFSNKINISPQNELLIMEEVLIKESRINNPYKWICASIKKFRKQTMVFHSFWHCILLNIFTVMVQYPLSLKEVSIVNVSNEKNINNLCGGIIQNLFMCGAITNAFYLLGSVSYRIFIVGTTPSIFYKIHYPVCILILLGATIAIWFDLVYWLVLLLISLATIIPYYLTYYDYYLFTEKCSAKSYGFILGLYGTSTTLTTAVVQLVYLANPSFSIMLGINIGLLVGNLVYSYYLSSISKESNHAKSNYEE